MDQYAPGTTEFAELEHHWGSAYVFTCEPPGKPQPVQGDPQGRKDIRAGRPETLFAAVQQDCQARPVPRDVAP